MTDNQPTPSASTNVVDLIPQWTFEDFATGLAPYEYLYNLRAYPVKQRQQTVLASNRAKAVGYGADNFKQTNINYIKEMRAASADPYANTTDFDGQELALNCGVYQCDDLGVRRWDSQAGEVVICTHPIMPVRRLVNIDTGEVKQEIAFKRGKRWRKAIFDKTALANAQRIVGLASCGVGVDSENAREMVRYMSAMENMNYDTLPEAKSVGRLGWVDGYGFSPYVENLVFDGNDQYRHAFESVRSCGGWDEWLRLALAVRSGGSLAARVALAASFASALVKPLDALPFIVHLWGGTGSGKSVGLMFAASVWACPSIGEYVKSFNGTAVANELQAAFCGSLPLCLDELQCIKDRGKFDELIYMLCEGAGKARGAKSGGLQRVTTWRNCTISTGEMPLTNAQSGAGAVNRVIEMDCKDEKLFTDPRGAVAVMTRNYGHAGRRFIEALRSSDVMSTLKDTQEAYYEQLAGKATDKQALAASVLLTADAMAEMLIFEDGRALTVDELLPALTTNLAADVNRRAYEWLLGTVAANPARFDMTTLNTGERWGQVDGKRVWIIKVVFNRLMNDGGYSADSFMSWAARNGYVEVDKGHNTKVRRLGASNAPVRCVCLRMDYGLDDGEVVEDEDNGLDL